MKGGGKTVRWRRTRRNCWVGRGWWASDSGRAGGPGTEERRVRRSCRAYYKAGRGCHPQNRRREVADSGPYWQHQGQWGASRALTSSRTAGWPSSRTRKHPPRPTPVHRCEAAWPPAPRCSWVPRESVSVGRTESLIRVGCDTGQGRGVRAERGDRVREGAGGVVMPCGPGPRPLRRGVAGRLPRWAGAGAGSPRQAGPGRAAPPRGRRPGQFGRGRSLAGPGAVTGLQKWSE